jgi:preprotein translocase subunit SecE
MARQGGDSPRTPATAGRSANGGATNKRPSAAPARERTTPSQYFAEVRSELKKVAWPTREETIQSSLVVLIAVTVMTALIFGFDWASSHFVVFLFG